MILLERSQLLRIQSHCDPREKTAFSLCNSVTYSMVFAMAAMLARMQ
jgi:hypothetical protein